MKLTFGIACVYDHIWEKLRDVPFAEKLRVMLSEMRYVKPPFDQVPIDMCEFTNWDDMSDNYEEHLPAFFCLVEYLVRQLFKYLFGDQGCHVFAWYQRSKALNNPVTTIILEQIPKCSKNSAERRVLLSCFMRAHKATEIRTILENYPELLAEVKTKMKEAGSSVADGDVNDATDRTTNSGENSNAHAASTTVGGSGESGQGEGDEGMSAGETNNVSRNDPIVRNLFPDTEARELTRTITLPGDIQVGTTPGGPVTSRTWGRDWGDDDHGRCENVTSPARAQETSGSGVNESMGPSTQQSSTGEQGNSNDEQPSSEKTSTEDNGTVSMSEGEALYMKRRATKDWYCIQKDGTIKLGHTVKRRLHEDIITSALRYILDSNNVQLMAWGTKRIRIKGEYRRFPKLVRKACIEKIWKGYHEDQSFFNHGGKKMKRTTFTSIVSALTTGDVKQRACVDYKLHALVYENASVLRRVIEDHVTVIQMRKELKKKLEAVMEFLKYSYITHLDDDSQDPMHSTKFALNHGTFATKTMESKCRECNAPYKFLKEIREAIVEPNAMIQKILTGAAFKFEQFMGHKVRARTQEARIKRMFDWVRDGEERKRAVVFIDFKMKLEPQRLRETQLQYYGKAGMSWHGSAVFYRPKENGDNMFRPLRKKRELNELQLKEYSDVEQARIKEKQESEGSLCTFFVDHIIENDKRQDRILTASIIEALVFRIKKQLAECEEIVFCSDNAKNYNNNIIPLLLPVICESVGLKLTTYIHPDACCGKSCVDAHFAISFKHVKTYICEKRYDVLTPEDIVDALTFDGGIKNTYVDYIRTNRNHRTITEYECAEVAKLVANLEAPSEIRYEKQLNGTYLMKCYKYSGCYYRCFTADGHESLEILNIQDHNAADKETFSSEEERIVEKERLEIANEEESANMEGGGNGQGKKRKKKKKEAGPKKPPRMRTVENRRKKYQKLLLKEVEKQEREQREAVNDGNATQSLIDEETCNGEGGEREDLCIRGNGTATDVLSRIDGEEPVGSASMEDPESGGGVCGDGDRTCSGQEDRGTASGSNFNGNGEDGIDEEEAEDGSEGEDEGAGENSFDVVMERYGYDCTQGEECDLDESDYVGGVINMTEEVNELRRSRGREMYYDMAILHQGECTGVQIKFMSGGGEIREGSLITTANTFAEAEAAITDAATNSDESSNDEGGGRAASATGSGANAATDTTENHGDGNEDENGDGTEFVSSRKRRRIHSTFVSYQEGKGYKGSGEIMECEKCEKMFTRKQAYEKHVGRCEEDSSRRKGDAIDQALEKAHDMVYKDQTSGMYTRHTINPELAKIPFDESIDCKAMRRGWARRAKWGTALGDNTMAEFKHQIKTWFDIGSAHPEKKMSAARMVKLLQAQHPHRYDMPTEVQVRNCISSFSDDEKKQRKEAAAKRLHTEKNVVRAVSTAGTGKETAVSTGGTGKETVPGCPGVNDGDVLHDEGNLCADRDMLDVSTPERPRTEAEVRREHRSCSKQGGTGEEGDGNMERVVSAESCASQQNPSATTDKAPKYFMPAKYADVLKSMVVANMDIKRTIVRAKMVEQLGLQNSALPPDFPTEMQVRRKVTMVKYRENKDKAERHAAQHVTVGPEAMAERMEDVPTV